MAFPPSPNPRPRGETYALFEGIAFSVDILVSDMPANYFGMPPGLSAEWRAVAGNGNNHIRVSGTPTAQGIYTLYRGTSALGTLLAKFNVGPPPFPRPTNSPPAGRKAVFYSHQVTASPGANLSFSFSDLPEGLSGDTSGLISGTPLVEYVSGKMFNNHIIATGNPAGVDTPQSIVIWEAPPQITSSLTAEAIVGIPFSYTILAPSTSVASAGTSFAASGLPTGLSVNSSTGVISGTPTGPAPCSEQLNIYISAANATGGAGGTTATDTKLLSLTFRDVQPPTVTPATLPIVYFNEAMTSYQVIASRCATSFAVVSGLPAGCALSSAGILSGTPTTPGTYPIIVRAFNQYGSNTGTITLPVRFRAPVFTNPDPEDPCSQIIDWVAGVAGFSYDVEATNLPQNFGATGLPPGLSINSSTGVISGTPASVSENTIVTLSVDNAGAYIDPITFGLVPNDPATTTTLTINIVSSAAAITPEITSDLEPLMDNGIASGIRGIVFEEYQITATHCPTLWGATDLPPGLSIDTATGEITGTPTSVGFFDTTVSASNLWGTGSDVVRFVISYPAPVITSPLYTYGIRHASFDPPVSLGGGSPDGYHIAASVSDPGDVISSYSAVDELPLGLSVNTTTGVISGTILADRGIYSVNISASNAGAYTVPLLPAGTPNLTVPEQPPEAQALLVYVYANPPTVTDINPSSSTESGGMTATITGTGFLSGATVLFGHMTFTEGVNVQFVDSTTLTVQVPPLPFSDLPYDVIVKNPDEQAGTLVEGLVVTPSGASALEAVRYTSLLTAQSPIYNVSDTIGKGSRRKRAFGLGTNIEVLFYSGIDTAAKQLLNVHRKQLGTNSTRHAASDLVFKGIASVQAAPFMFKTDATNFTHLDCVLRSDGKIELTTKRPDQDAYLTNISHAYAAYQMILVRGIGRIDKSKIGSKECEEDS